MNCEGYARRRHCRPWKGVSVEEERWAPAQGAQENVTRRAFDQRDQSAQVSSWVAGVERVHARVTRSDRVCEFESRSADKDRRGSSSLMHGNAQPEVYTGPSPVNECAGNSAVESSVGADCVSITVESRAEGCRTVDESSRGREVQATA
jgi:hypothetical protein